MGAFAGEKDTLFGSIFLGFSDFGLKKQEKGAIVVDFEGILIFIDFSIIFGIPNHRKSIVLDKGKPSRNIVNNEVSKRSGLFYRI